MGDTVTIYDLEIPEELFDSVQDKLQKLDKSRNYGKKHTGRQAFKLLDALLEEEENEINKSINDAERRINRLKDFLEE